jgi:hypothetical protein
MSYQKRARSNNRCGPFIGDTSETTYAVLHSKLPCTSERSPRREKGGTTVAGKRAIPHTYVDLLPYFH